MDALSGRESGFLMNSLNFLRIVIDSDSINIDMSSMYIPMQYPIIIEHIIRIVQNTSSRNSLCIFNSGLVLKTSLFSVHSFDLGINCHTFLFGSLLLSLPIEPAM